MSDTDCEVRLTNALQRRIERQGFAFVRGAEMRELLELAGALHDWDTFAESWNDLEIDTHMADGGRYRRRRHATFEAQAGRAARRLAHAPHFQTRDYNPLNGGVARWFAPVTESTGNSASLRTILAAAQALFESLAPQASRWFIELHQFRIEAHAAQFGQPTPEGMHRDGVDYVLVMLVRRHNIASGTTSIHDLERRELGSFTLSAPFDAALVEDSRVFHGVTPVEPVDVDLPAYRDVLVATFRRQA